MAEKKTTSKTAATKKTASKKTASKKTASKKTATKKATATKAASSAAAAGAQSTEKVAAGKPGRIRVTLVRSPTGKIGKHRDTVRGLGLRRMHHSVELDDTPEIRGMVRKVDYLVRVEEI